MNVEITVARKAPVGRRDPDGYCIQIIALLTLVVDEPDPADAAIAELADPDWLD